MVLRIFFISLVKIVGAFIFLFFINKKLALPLILLVIVMFVFSFRQNAKNAGNLHGKPA